MVYECVAFSKNIPKLGLFASVAYQYNQQESHQGGHKKGEKQPYPYMAPLGLSLHSWNETTRALNTTPAQKCLKPRHSCIMSHTKKKNSQSAALWEHAVTKKLQWPQKSQFQKAGGQTIRVDRPDTGITKTGWLHGPHPAIVHAATWKVALKKRPAPERRATLSLKSKGSYKDKN